MVHASFRQSVAIDGRRFMIKQDGQPVVHEVPAEIVKHPHFKKYVKAGIIAVGEGEIEKKDLETIEQRNIRLAQKVSEKHGLQKTTSGDISEDDEADFGEEPTWDDEDPKKKKAKKK